MVPYNCIRARGTERSSAESNIIAQDTFILVAGVADSSDIVVVLMF